MTNATAAEIQFKRKPMMIRATMLAKSAANLAEDDETYLAVVSISKLIFVVRF